MTKVIHTFLIEFIYTISLHSIFVKFKCREKKSFCDSLINKYFFLNEKVHLILQANICISVIFPRLIVHRILFVKYTVLSINLYIWYADSTLDCQIPHCQLFGRNCQKSQVAIVKFIVDIVKFKI